MKAPWDEAREQIFKKLLAEVQQLEEDLRLAHEASLIAKKDRPDEAKTLAAIGALSAVCHYLRALKIDQRYWNPLLELWDKNKKKFDFAEAAAVVTVMINAGEKSALKRVAKTSGLDEVQIENSRNNLSRDPPRGHRCAVALYERLLSIAAASGVPLREQVQTLLQGLREKSDKNL